MLISAINGFNNSISIKKRNQNYINNKKVEERNTASQIKNYGQNEIGAVKNKPSFGFDAFSLALLGYALLYAGVIGAGVYQTGIDERTRKKEEQKLARETEASIDNISEKLRVPYHEAREYHYNFLRLAEIKPTNDGNEKGLNAVQGYGIEKYKLAMDVIAPIIAKNTNRNLGYSKQIPNGVILYGPTGGGKTYIADKVCEHMEYFGVPVENVNLDGSNHSKNVRSIQNAFLKAEENYKKTGKITVINFKEDADVFFLDRRTNPECVKEVRALLKYGENCAKKGAVWIGTANNPQMMDAAILRPGRTDVKIPIGDMEDFAIADMLKYTLYKYDEKESSETFDYPKVIDTMKNQMVVYTPAELELFVAQAKNNKLLPKQEITADMVIAEMQKYSQNDFPTLTDEMIERFSKDKDYIASFEEKTPEDNLTA